MKVKTFDLLTGEKIECEFKSLSIGGLMTLTTKDEKTIVRHMNRCEYERKELEEWHERIMRTA